MSGGGRDPCHHIDQMHVFGGGSHSPQAFSGEWCDAGRMSRLRMHAHPRTTWGSPAVQIAQQTQNDDTEYRATMGGQRENGLGCYQRLLKKRKKYTFST